MNKSVETESITEIINEYDKPLKSFIGKRVYNREDAEDILQEVFYQLTRTLKIADSPIEQVSAWLYRVTRNLIINQGKKKRAEEMPVFQYDEDGMALNEFSEVLFGDDNSTPENEYLRSLVWQELEEALKELPVEQSEAFNMTEIKGLSVREAAKEANISENTLLSRKHYAVKHLRIRMAELYNDIINS